VLGLTDPKAKKSDSLSGNVDIDPVLSKPTEDALQGSGTKPPSRAEAKRRHQIEKAEEKRRRQIEAARNRREWRKSKEAAQARRNTSIALATIPLWALSGALIGNFYADALNEFVNKKLYILSGLGIGTFVGIYVIGALIIVFLSQARRDIEDRRLIGEAQEELKQTELEITGNVSADFVTLWSATQKRLDLYHQIATNQSQRSFLYGQIAAGAGFVVIIVAALIAGLSKSTGASVAAAVSGVAGGGLAAYIGKTFIKSQEAATAQLRAYFNQPLEFSRYLEAERLLALINDKSQHTSSVNSIIASITNSPIVTAPAEDNSERPLPRSSGRRSVRSQSSQSS
jgi:hypothetical protein